MDCSGKPEVKGSKYSTDDKIKAMWRPVGGERRCTGIQLEHASEHVMALFVLFGHRLGNLRFIIQYLTPGCGLIIQ